MILLLIFLLLTPDLEERTVVIRTSDSFPTPHLCSRETRSDFSARGDQAELGKSSKSQLPGAGSLSGYGYVLESAALLSCPPPSSRERSLP